ncbi:hypothetical protein ACFX2I_014605 [Malus domestica]
MEEEQYHRMQEAQHLVQENGNIASRFTCPTLRHPHFELPISNRLEQSNQEQIWNNYGERRCRDVETKLNLEWNMENGDVEM